MNKQEQIKLILDAIKKSGKGYEILNGNDAKPSHIRITGWGDIWPSTGTFKKGKKFTRKNVPLLIKELGSEYTPPQAKPRIAMQDIIKRLNDLEEYATELEYRIFNSLN